MKSEYLIIEADAYELLCLRVRELLHTVQELKNKIKPEYPEWMDAQQVCQALHISKRSLQYYRQAGIVLYSMIGNKVYFKIKDIQKVLDSSLKR